MDDMERYGDYNEVDEPPSKNKVLLAIKIVAIVLIFSVIGLLAFRLVMFNYYPNVMKSVYFNEKLTAFYNEKDGNIGAKTQTLKAPYDDAEEGNFMADYLVFIPELSQLQITIKINQNLYNKLAGEFKPAEGEEYSITSFGFRLIKSEKREDKEEDKSGSEDKEIIGSATGVISNALIDSFVMYDYIRLVFDEVDFTPSENGYWIWLEIFVDGDESGEPYGRILLLDTSETDYKIRDYELSGGEEPR